MMTGILRFPSIMHMTDLNRASLDKYIRSVGVRQIRLACGPHVSRPTISPSGAPSPLPAIAALVDSQYDYRRIRPNVLATPCGYMRPDHYILTTTCVYRN